MNVVVLVILVLPLLILLLDLPIMPQNGGVLLTRLYIILLVPYVLSSRLLCYTLFCRLPNSFMVQIRGEQVGGSSPHPHSCSLTPPSPVVCENVLTPLLLSLAHA